MTYYILGRDRAQAIRWALYKKVSLQACNFLDGNSIEAATKLDFSNPDPSCAREVILLDGWDERTELREVSHYVVKKFIQQRRLTHLDIVSFE